MDEKRKLVNVEKWQRKYELAKSYYEHHGNLEIKEEFKTTNGYEYDELGTRLGNWIQSQRAAYREGKPTLTSKQISLLEEIGMRFGPKISEFSWDQWYELATKYYEHHGNLEISRDFKTLNGYEPAENGYKLGAWIANRRSVYNNLLRGKMTDKQIEQLKAIGMRFDNFNDLKWEERYKLACAYYEHYGNLEILADFKTTNGYDYDEKGIKLGKWLATQRTLYRKKELSSEKIEKLLKLNARLKPIYRNNNWEQKYKIAETYYKHHGNLEVSFDFKTINGYDYDEKGMPLGTWIITQRNKYNGKGSNRLSAERIKKLKAIGMRFNTNYLEEEWYKKYKVAASYYKHYGNLRVEQGFRTINGYTYNEDGFDLGHWIARQRIKTDITPKQIELLNQIGMIWYGFRKTFHSQEITEENTVKVKTQLETEVKELLVNLSININSKEDLDKITNRIIRLEKLEINPEKKRVKQVKVSKNYEKWLNYYNLAKSYYEHNGNLEVEIRFKTTNGYEPDQNGIGLGDWVSRQRYYYKNDQSKLSPNQIKMLEEIGMSDEKIPSTWYKKYNLAVSYYEHHKNLDIPALFITKNGYEYDEDGEKLGKWLSKQKNNVSLSTGQINLLNKLDVNWITSKPAFRKLEITSENSNKVKLKLLGEFRKMLELLPTEINSKEDIEKINDMFIKSLVKKTK